MEGPDVLDGALHVSIPLRKFLRVLPKQDAEDFGVSFHPSKEVFEVEHVDIGKGAKRVSIPLRKFLRVLLSEGRVIKLSEFPSL